MKDIWILRIADKQFNPGGLDQWVRIRPLSLTLSVYRHEGATVFTQRHPFHVDLMSPTGEVAETIHAKEEKKDAKS